MIPMFTSGFISCLRGSRIVPAKESAHHKPDGAWWCAHQEGRKYRSVKSGL